MPLTYSVTADSFTDLLKLLQEFVGSNGTQTATTETTAAPAQAKRGRKPKGEVTETAPVAEEVKEEAAETEGSAIEYADVSKATMDVAVKVGRSAALKLLEEFGAPKDAKKLDPSKYAAFIAAATRLIEENEEIA